MELDKKALDNLDLEVDPRGFTEEDKMAVRAYIAACKKTTKKTAKRNQQKETHVRAACCKAL
ncbi:MAG: hypothetical protein LBS46_06825 [Dysgonamonadaceae bacterium]|jgi:hypothetical protein|nr:hypothetical protein [Dysgonamonadaceae bacterium]